MLPSNDESKNSVIHFVWGDFFLKKLLNVGVDRNNIFITGNIRTDNATIEGLNRVQFAEKFNLDTNKKWILFCENRTWIYSFTQKKKDHRISMGFLEEDMNERKELLKKSIELTLSEFENMSNDFFEKYEIIYRTHPGTLTPKNINHRIKVIEKYSFYNWLNVIDVNVVWGSTTVFESDLLGIPSFVYEPIRHTKKFKPYGLERYQIITEFNDINDELCDFYLTNIKDKKIFEEYLGKNDRKSTKRTSDIIIEILINGIPGYKANLIPYSNEAMKRIKKRECKSKAIVKLNLLELLKRPVKAYEFRNDIPYRKRRLEYINKILLEENKNGGNYEI